MNREDVIDIIKKSRRAGTVPDLRGADLGRADLRGADLGWSDLGGADLRGADLGWSDLRRADLRWSDLRRADLRGADLGGSNLDFAAWPLWCGGTGATLDRRLSLQLIYHVFNNNHTDPEILEALEPLRPLAQEFIDKHRSDAPELIR